LFERIVRERNNIMTTFEGLNLAQPILRAVTNEGYTTPSPIQEQSIPSLLEGHDLMGVAQTGTGKTAAFALPILHLLDFKTCKLHRRQPRALILAPTRELAVQIGENIKTYGRHLDLRSTVVFGGASIRTQTQKLSQGVHIVVATPGRLLDLMNQGKIQLGQVEMFVLDEADRMLDMGFIPDVRKIAKALPEKRQTVMFSATMPTAVRALADGLLNDPVHVEITPAATTVEKVEQRVMFMAKDKKRASLSELFTNPALKRVLVFTRTKHGADKVAKYLAQGGVKSDAIHGNKSQNARQHALRNFSSGNVRALVATDVAARGIDVDGITHVINFELPNEPESYVHRIGRTARAGASGIAISFCDGEERGYLRDIERTISQTITVIEDHPYHDDNVANDPGTFKRGSKNRSRNRAKGGARNDSRNGSARSDSRGGSRNNSRDDSRGDSRGSRFGGPKNGARQDTRGTRPQRDHAEVSQEPQHDSRGEFKNALKNETSGDSRSDSRSDPRASFRSKSRNDSHGGARGDFRRESGNDPRKDAGNKAGRYKHQDAKPAAQHVKRDKPEQSDHQDFRPKAKPSSKHGMNAGAKPGDKPGTNNRHKPKAKSGAKPTGKFSGKPGDKPGSKSGAKPAHRAGPSKGGFKKKRPNRAERRAKGGQRTAA
jgi:ATP-dependent RNA helicase RhlE